MLGGEPTRHPDFSQLVEHIQAAGAVARVVTNGGRAAAAERTRDQRGDVPGWVLIVLMTSALVVAVWGVARDRLIAIVSSALSTVCGGIGC